MLIVALAWMYVVVMMALAEAVSPQGSVLGAVFTLLLYGVGPLAVVLYILATPTRRKLRRQREAQEATAAAASSASTPDGGGHAPGDAVSAERKEA